MAKNEIKKARKVSAKKGSKTGEDITLVEGLKSISEGWYSGIKQEWSKNYGYWENTFGQGGQFLKTKVDLPIGLAWMIVDGVLAAMTDGRPKPVFLPQEGNDIDKSQVLAKIITGPLWESLHLEENTEELLKASLAQSGACVSRAFIDNDGQLHDKVYDPYHCDAEPNVRKIEDMEFFITNVPVAVGKIRRAYGSAADHVVAEDIDDSARRRYFGRAGLSARMTSDNKFPFYDPKKFGDSFDHYARSVGRAILTHVWVEDYDEGEIAFDDDEAAEEYMRALNGQEISAKYWENHVRHIRAHKQVVNSLLQKWDLTSEMFGAGGVEASGDEMDRDLRAIEILMAHINEHLQFPQSERGMLYPMGKEIWIAGGKVLAERKSEFGNPYKAFQFDRDIAGNFWGRSLMSYLVPMQEAFNYLVNKIETHADLVANSRMFYNARLKVLWDKIREKMKGKTPVGVMIPTDGPPGAGNIVWDNGGSMPGYIFQMLGALEQWGYKLGGFTEVMQGSVPAYASGRAIGQALQSAGVRIRKSVKHLGWYYQAKFRDYIKYLRYADQTTIFNILDGNKNERVALSDIDFDAIDDVRIDVRNVLGSWREEQFDKLTGIMERNPALAQIILPALVQYLDENLDTKKLDREGQLESSLAVLHDELGMMKAGMKSNGK